jgi:hypothetical protein
MSATEEPEGHEHIGDKYFTYNRHNEGRSRTEFPPFPPSSEEEEEVHREAERRAEHDTKREGEMILGEKYEQPKGRSKAPMEP